VPRSPLKVLREEVKSAVEYAKTHQERIPEAGVDDGGR